MREILFRGRQFDHQGWLYGSLIVARGIVLIGREDGSVRSVDPDTVGQYTGQSDKTGQRIFEGDILAFTNSDNEVTPYQVRWSRHGWTVLMCGETVDEDELDDFFTAYSKVIGNIHDNPELLEE